MFRGVATEIVIDIGLVMLVQVCLLPVPRHQLVAGNDRTCDAKRKPLLVRLGFVTFGGSSTMFGFRVRRCDFLHGRCVWCIVGGRVTRVKTPHVEVRRFATNKQVPIE